MSELALRQPPMPVSVPRSLAQSLTELPFGSQTQIRVREGQLSAFLAYIGYDKQVGTAKYALRVLNNTPATAYARVFVDVKGSQQSAYPKDIEVGPFSMRDDVIPIRMDVTGRFTRAIVAVSSEDNFFTVEAPPPPKEKFNWVKWCAIAAIPFVAGGAAQLYTPRILAVEAPAKALAGSPLQVPFQVSGIGTVEYDLRNRQGLQLAAGLAASSGVLNLKIPNGASGSPYTLHVRMRNQFLRAEQTTAIAAVVQGTASAKPPASPAALIQNLAVTPSPVEAGKTLGVRYVSKAQRGDVYLVDADGATWAHRPLSPDGTSWVNVPQSAAGKEMRVVLHAQQGTQQAEASVGIAVMPSAQVLAQKQVATTTPAAASPQPTSAPVTPTLTLSSQVVAPGDTITASIAGVKGDVRITLISTSGATLAQGDADEETGGVTLTAPSVTAPTTFFVVASLTSGVSQQSIVKRLVVTPR